MGKEKSETLFGSAESIVEQTREPRLIARRVEQIERANKNKAKSTKKLSKNSKNLNHNSTKHL